MTERNLTIIKIGTNALIDADGRIRDELIDEALSVANSMLANGSAVLIVTSGAVRLGRNHTKGKELSKAVAASVGQPILFSGYEVQAKKLGIHLAHFLLTRASIVDRTQFLNFQKTCQELFDLGIVPIVNEDDAITAGTDWSFGDNDSLAAALAVSLAAKQLIIVSHVKGLFDKDPTKEKDAKLISEISNLNDTFLEYSSKSVSANSSGGMMSKLKAARICIAAGIAVSIISGLDKGTLTKACKGESAGTRFQIHERKNAIANRERWILAAKNSAGSIQVDKGAAEALTAGKSLLAVGVKKIYGVFEANEIIEILNDTSKGIAFGIVEASSKDIEDMIAKNDTYQKRLIHANNLFIL